MIAGSMVSRDKILSTLKPEHPRLLIDDATIARVKGTIEGNPHAARWYEKIVSDGDEILTQPASHYEIPDGRRLLSISRQVKERVRTLGLIYLLEGANSHRDRIWAEVEAAAGFKDWNPIHFLDTAEMTHALALAYDWLYDAWDDAQRQTMVQAIVTLGLQPGMDVYRSGGWWPKNENNWNQVCNGGLGVGALAVADVYPELAADVLYEAIQSLPRAMGHYAPDGAGTEGVTYWDYGTRYNLIFLSALESALGTDFGLSQIEAFDSSGGYQLYMSGADRLAFDFGDSGLRRMSTPQHFWMGRRYNQPEYSWFRYSELEHPQCNGGVLDLLWFDDSAAEFNPAALPLDRHYRVAESVSMRSAWDDPNALVVALHAGQNRDGGHRHLDLGSFILEAMGERWVIDSGMEREAYQRHRNKRQRWEFYRLRAEGHNTLVINPDGGPDQELDAFAALETQFEADRASATVDLSQAYAGRARRVRRTLSMVDRSYVLIEDEVETDAPADVWWFLHTEAEVELNDQMRTATLRANGKRVVVKIEAPTEACFQIMDARPLPSSPNPQLQASNEGRRKLSICLTGVVALKLLVRITPVWT
jgi:hypothetical protein